MSPATSTPISPSDARALRRAALFAGVVAVILACLLGAWIFARGNRPFGIDTWWNDALVAWTSSLVLGFAHVMDAIGGGVLGAVVVPVVVVALFLVFRRPWIAAYFLAAELVSAGAVQVLKHLFGRARPEEIIVMSDFGSFPSGHVANAATIATVGIVLLPRIWTFLAGGAWVVLMAFSRTYLHAHWLSDTLGGALIGSGTALLLAAAFAARLRPLAPRALPDRQRR